MITYVVGNLFESPAKVLVNTVNTVGVMGKGIAKEFKSIYPDMFSQYQRLCEDNKFSTGQLWLYKTPHKWVLNFPTKSHWRHPSKLQYIEAGLSKFAATYKEKGIPSIAFPMLGCGNGELDWETQVRPLMEQYLKNLLLDVYIYIYRKGEFVPEHRNPEQVKAWLRGEPGSLPFGEFMDDLENLFGRDGLLLSVGEQTVNYYMVLESSGVLGLKIQGCQWTDLVEHDQLFALWRNIRSTGFLTPETLPSGLEHLFSPLRALLLKLGYFRPVALARQYEDIPRQADFLQLVSPLRPVGNESHSAAPQVVGSYGTTHTESGLEGNR